MNGAFAGGMAKGIESAETAALAERKQAAEEEKTLYQRAESQITNTMTTVAEVIKANAVAGKSPEQIRALVSPLIESVKPIATKLGRDPSQLDKLVEAQVNTPQTDWQKKLYDLQVQKFAADNQYRKDELELRRQEIANKGQKLVLTPAQQAVDTKFGEDYASFVAGGGYADVEKQLGQLDTVLKDLQAGKKNLTGPWRGSLPDGLVAQTEEGRQAIAAREAVQEVVQRNLKTVLGSQFTEKEGDALIKRAFNPQLEEAENAQRLERLITQIRTAAKQKQEAVAYYESHGTLRGFTGKLPTFNDILGDKAPARSGAEVPPPPKGFVVTP